MTQKPTNNGQLTFWEHLDQLRGSIFRILAVVLALGVVAFAFKEQLFAVLLAPKQHTFVTYRLIERLVGVSVGEFSVDMINTGLAQQFMIHLKAAFAVGFLVATPYILHVAYSFVSPALYHSERRVAVRLVGGGYLMFMLGVALNYFVIFPLTFRFLGTYHVSVDVPNLISLESYMSTLLMLSLVMGLMFEMPVVAWLLARMGFVGAEFMRRYRRHAVVAILVVAAVITPTADAFTLCIVAVPIYLLYELGILVAARAERHCDAA